uniref:Cysteine--tRNA ligase n=1 Tax=uncultured microorganism TaxID=358574 RepID=F8U8W4_9ZZZZ|nr:tRNA synthetase-like protein [uncultured microorganism]
MREIYLRNTLTKKKELVEPIDPGKIRFYQCGPTVYWVQHVGNMRAVVLADLIHRTFEYVGYDVKFVRNYTDVGHLVSDDDEGEDKMTKGAKREGLSPDVIADKYIRMFEEDTQSLNILSPDLKPRATEFVPQMIKAVQLLIEKGYAYVTPKAVYFDTSKAENYTALSGQVLEKNIAGAGHGEVEDSDKRNPEDFVVWVFKTGIHKNALQYWGSPFESLEVENGEGFPGWHLECSVMLQELLGDTVDVHMGGIEHIPVHHTNEIAQSEALTGEKFVNYWLHNEHIMVNGKKMSKSAGTSYVLSDLVERGYDPLDLRYFFLGAHYRSKQNFTWEALDGARSAREKLVAAVAKLRGAVDSSEVDSEWKEKFLGKLSDDINVPEALALVWEMMKSDLVDDKKLGTILDFDKVLGLNLAAISSGTEASEDLKEKIEDLIEKRTLAKSERDFQAADAIREELGEMGIALEDTQDGTVWRLG